MLIDRIQDLKNLPPQEQALADYICKNPNRVIDMTSRQLASETYTSASTIVRLCKKIGVKGFSDFKICLASEIAGNSSGMYVDVSQPLITQQMTSNQFLQLSKRFYNRIIYETSQKAHIGVFNQVADQICRSEQIMLFGTGINYSLAQNAAFKFSSLGIETCACNEINMQNLINTNFKKRFAILISHTGSNACILNIAKYLKRYHVAWAGISCDPESKLIKLCDYALLVINTTNVEAFSLLAYTASIQYVLDTLYIFLLSKKKHNLWLENAECFYSLDSER